MPRLRSAPVPRQERLRTHGSAHARAGVPAPSRAGEADPTGDAGGPVGSAAGDPDAAVGAAAAVPQGSRSALKTVGAYVALTKPRIIELLLVTTVPTMVLANEGLPSLWLVVATLIGGTLAAGGANAVNMYVDRDIDRIMQRTRHRPLVTGAVTPRAALTFAIGIEVAAFAWLTATVNLLSAVLALSACLFYVFVYTLWLKRTSTQNIVIGGAAGAVPVLVGWAAVKDSLSLAPVLLFAVIFFWTPPHFWALAVKYRDDYAAARVPMLPAVATLGQTSTQIVGYSVIVWALTLALPFVSETGLIYLGTALLSGGLFLLMALRLHREPTAKQAMRLFSYSISYLTLVFVAVAVDQLIPVHL